MADAAPTVLVMMGVSGCGKTTVGEAVAGTLGVPFIEGDALHPPANIGKMSAGIALTDADRWPWLDAVADALRAAALSIGVGVGSCSALTRAYRDRLRNRTGLPVLFVHLDAPLAALTQRVAGRADHFMPASLVESQLAILQPPGADEVALRLDATRPATNLVRDVLIWLERCRSVERDSGIRDA